MTPNFPPLISIVVRGESLKVNLKQTSLDIVYEMLAQNIFSSKKFIHKDLQSKSDISNSETEPNLAWQNITIEKFVEIHFSDADLNFEGMHIIQEKNGDFEPSHLFRISASLLKISYTTTISGETSIDCCFIRPILDNYLKICDSAYHQILSHRANEENSSEVLFFLFYFF
jgi:hypothetical protein